eukprot:TRINITY_DN7986_c0_g1_i1.p1 TRINITY_DN7986_c0_g1~~TRINITY_DN7986_c0_g1_i1.p1  ORF type:complete len:559 (+),score=102.41 TRINITY_DN7986_c0_g1_i1:64-1740(+)
MSTAQRTGVSPREATPSKTKVTRTIAKDRGGPASRDNSSPSPALSFYNSPNNGSFLSVPSLSPPLYQDPGPDHPTVISITSETSPRDHIGGEVRRTDIEMRTSLNLPKFRDSLDHRKHASSSNIFANMQTHYSTHPDPHPVHTTGYHPTFQIPINLSPQTLPGSVGFPPQTSPREKGLESVFSNLPSIEILCENYAQMRKIKSYFEEAKQKFNTNKEEVVLLKLFTEKFGKVGEGEITFEDDFSGIYKWEYKIGKNWTPFGPAQQEILETAFQKDQNSVDFSGEQPSMVVDIKKAVNNQSSYIVRRNINIVYIEGYMQKESAKLKMWKLMFVKLHENMVECINDSGVSILQIPLDAIMAVKSTFPGKEFAFSLEVWKGAAKSYNFSVPNADILNKWVYFINLARKKYMAKKSKELLIYRPNLRIKDDGKSQYSICFCSISTAAYKFDLEIASTVACQVFSSFLSQHPNAPITIYLVDRDINSHTIELFSKKQPKDPRMIVRNADLVRLKSEFDIPCWYIVNASNPKFSEGGSGTNEAIHEACKSTFTPSLQALTKKSS